MPNSRFNQNLEGSIFAWLFVCCSSGRWDYPDKNKHGSFLLLQQTAVQSSILILSHAVDRILQTCSVVKNSAATLQTYIALSDSVTISDAWKWWLTVIATCDKCQWPQQLMAKSVGYNWWHHIYKNHFLFQTGRWRWRMFEQPGRRSAGKCWRLCVKSGRWRGLRRCWRRSAPWWRKWCGNTGRLKGRSEGWRSMSAAVWRGSSAEWGQLEGKFPILNGCSVKYRKNSVFAKRARHFIY